MLGTNKVRPFMIALLVRVEAASTPTRQVRKLQSKASRIYSISLERHWLYGDDAQHVNRHGPTTAGGGFAASVGGLVIFTLGLTNAHMKIRRLSVLTLTAFIAVGACRFAIAADVDVSVRAPQATSLPPSARFEIVQSTIAARLTFRLDRYTGRVWELVKTKDDDNAWQETRVYERPQIASPTRARFQLFTSGLAARHTFLFDTDTGRSWVLVTGTQKEKDETDTEYRAWQLFAE